MPSFASRLRRLVHSVSSRLQWLPPTVAILTAKKADIPSCSDLFGIEEYLYIVILLWLGAYGAGPISLDAIFAKRLDRATP